MKNRIKILLLLVTITTFQTKSMEWSNIDLMEPMEPIEVGEPMEPIDEGTIASMEPMESIETSGVSEGNNGTQITEVPVSTPESILTTESATQAGEFLFETNSEQTSSGGAEANTEQVIDMSELDPEAGNNVDFTELNSGSTSTNEAMQSVEELTKNITEESTPEEIQESAVKSVEIYMEVKLSPWDAFTQWVSDLFNNWSNSNSSWNNFWKILFDTKPFLEGEFEELISTDSSVLQEEAPANFDSTNLTTADEANALQQLKSLGIELPENYTNTDITQAISDADITKNSEFRTLVDATVTLEQYLKQEPANGELPNPNAQAVPVSIPEHLTSWNF